HRLLAGPGRTRARVRPAVQLVRRVGAAASRKRPDARVARRACASAGLHHLLASNAFLFEGPEQRWTLMHHPSFDFAMWEIWGPLRHGHTLTVLGEQDYAQPPAVHAAVAGDRITHMGMTPPAAQLLLPLLEQRGTAALRCICLGGSSVPAPLVKRLRALGLGVRIFYGPT